MEENKNKFNMVYDKNIMTLVGHYGSGKSEIAVNLALYLAERGEKTALIDLDIANPYFRSRERRALLKGKGIDVYDNAYGYEIAADLPAIDPASRAPLEDSSVKTVVDAGGDSSGARILNQFHKYLCKKESGIYFVVNRNRRETADVDGVLSHLEAIEKETGLHIQGLINNTHMLSETGPRDVVKGYDLCVQVSQKTRIPLLFSCCRKDVLNEMAAEELRKIEYKVFPIELFMRPAWLDKQGCL